MLAIKAYRCNDLLVPIDIVLCQAAIDINIHIKSLLGQGFPYLNHKLGEQKNLGTLMANLDNA